MVRVATLNLLNNVHGRWDDREQLVIDQARSLDADVFAFQEVDARGGQVDRMVSGLGNGFRAVLLPNPDRGSIKSLAIVTRLPVVCTDHCTALDQGDLALWVRVEVRGDRHLDVATTHFHFSPTKRGSERRRRQAEQLLAWLDQNALGPTVVMGDFNSRDGGAAIALMKQRFRSSHEVVHGREPDATHPTPLVRALDAEKAFGLPFFPEDGGAAIDYVFVDDSIAVEHCSLAWTDPAPHEPNLYPSDHFGLVADLRVP